jgi:hypothetical protein
LPDINIDETNYKLIFNKKDPSLSYCGFIRPIITSLSSISELQARLISQVYSGKISLPSKKIMVNDKESYIINNNRINYLVNPYIYSDELAELIGCRPNLMKLFFKDHILWRQLIFYPWSQFQYVLNSENQNVINLAKKHLSNLQNSLTGIRLKKYTVAIFSFIILVILLGIGILIGLIFGFVKAKPYITKAFYILLFLIIPI